MSDFKIEVNNVKKEFCNKQGEMQLVLDSVRLKVKDGEFICLLGPSGCGKSTLLSIISGFAQPTEGEVLIDGNRVSEPNPRHVTIFQEYGLFPWRSVLGNVEFGLESAGVSKKERKEIALKFIEMVGLADFVQKHPQELSGGMRQRVALARALAVNPDIIFMDEPFGALDALTRYNMQEELVRIKQETGKTILFVTHDIDESVYLSDRVVIMTPYPGRIKSIVDIPLSRVRDRTSYDFTNIRNRIFEEFALKPVIHDDFVI